MRFKLNEMGGRLGGVRSSALAAVAAMAMTACTPTTVTETTTTAEVATTAAPDPTTTTSTSAASTTTAAPTTTLAQTTEREFGFVEPFAITMPPEWVRDPSSTQNGLIITADSNFLYFGISDHATVDEWQQFLTGHKGLQATEPQPAEVGGAQGFTTDVRVSAEAPETPFCGGGPCAVIIGEGTGWGIPGGSPNRVWVVDVGGRPVFIAAEAVEPSFESFVAEAEEALSTLRWVGD